jgi:hypothetical protein
MVKVQGMLQCLPEYFLLSTGTATKLAEEILSEHRSPSITFSVTLSEVFQYHILVQL